MQPVHGFPIETFPGPDFFMQPQRQECQNGSVNLVFVQRHVLVRLPNFLSVEGVNSGCQAGTVVDLHGNAVAGAGILAP